VRLMHYLHLLAEPEKEEGNVNRKEFVPSNSSLYTPKTLAHE
jgi:hypothetical protein